jgi:lipopolysaccharide export system permease protein
MRIVDRYVGRSVAVSSALVLLVLLSLFSFISFIGELGDIGKGNYGLFDAVQYVLLTLPSQAYQIIPLVALLGTTLGLGILAHNNELVVLRTSGVSLVRIVVSVMKVGLVLILISVALGEWAAPWSEQYAQSLRATAMLEPVTLRTEEGFWARDGNSFINIKKVLSDGRLEDIDIYEIDDQYRLYKLIHAGSASYLGNEWLLENIVNNAISEERVVTTKLPKIAWNTLINPELLDVVAVTPEKLSGWGLYKYIGYLNENGLAAGRYELALWGKIMSPIATGVMVFLSVPFIFGSLRTVSITQRILTSAFIGIGFHLFNQTVNYVALVYRVDPAFSAITPTVLFFILALYLMRRAN